MIIFGSRGVTTAPEKGRFNCPSCATQQDYALKRVRRFFTLYFIPLIPLNKLGEYVECRICKDTYEPDVLHYDPEAQAKAIEDEYHWAIKKVMVYTALASGAINDSVVDTLVQTYQRITGVRLARVELTQQLQQPQITQEELAPLLVNLQGTLNDEGKEAVVKSALYIALVDGDLQEQERQMLSDIGASLGMTHAHVHGVISSA